MKNGFYNQKQIEVKSLTVQMMVDTGSKHKLGPFGGKTEKQFPEMTDSINSQIKNNLFFNIKKNNINTGINKGAVPQFVHFGDKLSSEKVA